MRFNSASNFLFGLELREFLCLTFKEPPLLASGILRAWWRYGTNISWARIIVQLCARDYVCNTVLRVPLPSRWPAAVDLGLTCKTTKTATVIKKQRGYSLARVYLCVVFLVPDRTGSMGIFKTRTLLLLFFKNGIDQTQEVHL